jgi:hemerythrin-like domain-containing protein
MLDDIEFLDDSTRPEPPMLEGLTDEQREPGRHLAMIHDHLRENMKVLGRMIERASAGEVSAAEVAEETAGLAMVANYRRFGNLCGQHCQFVHTHHSIEDYAVFPELGRQGEAFRRIADRLRAEHVVVHEVLMRLVGSLEDLAREPNRGRFETAREFYVALERVLLSHLGYEERAMGDALGYFGIGA